MSNCKSCGAAIRWVVMTSGKRMPVDVRSQKLIVLNDMPEPRGSVVDCYTSHFMTCPNAAQHRVKR
jgi:hypothetical protein